MKSQKTNAFQLAIAGGVLVLVLACATFAWFAISDHAWVERIVSSVKAPDVPSQLNSIEYQSGNLWIPYEGGHLDIEPGKVYTFRVKFTAKEDDMVSIAMRDFSVTLREAIKEEDDSQSNEPTTEYKVVTEENMLSDVFLYRLNPKEDTPFAKLPVDKASNSAIIVNNQKVEASCKDANYPQYTYVYEIKMSEEADNTYMGKILSFVMAVDLPDSDSEGKDSAEG